MYFVLDKGTGESLDKGFNKRLLNGTRGRNVNVWNIYQHKLWPNRQNIGRILYLIRGPVKVRNKGFNKRLLNGTRGRT